VELPPYLQVEPVGQCNLRCTMCPIQFRQDGPPYGPPAFMDFELFARLVDQFPGLEELHLQGLGEPMMHPRFFDMVEYGAARGIRVSTNTNLTLLTRERARRCMTAGLAWMRISVDGATAETYEKIRVRSKLARLERNLALLREAKHEAGGGGPRLEMTAVVMRQNLHELPDLVRFAHRWGLQEIFVQHLCHELGEADLPAQYVPLRDYVEAQSLEGEDPGRVARYFNEARAVAEGLGVGLRLPRARPVLHPPGTPGRQRCDWPWRGAYVAYRGEAMPCCMIATPDRLTLGNMADGVAAAWNGEAYEAFRKALDSDDPPAVCKSCSVYRGTF
jgi:radical SAM protein with 4Fe4S-binding SPASM domain